MSEQAIGPGRMPALFLGHGSPMNALGDNPWAEAWSALGSRLPRPQAIVCVSAHWFRPAATAVTAMQAPPTIHDFGGFPPQLYAMTYPAPGDPALARRVCELLGPAAVADADSWGLDHGAWSVLCHVYPQADIPVVQVSLDATLPPEGHYDLGRRLQPLRDEGVLVLGSGNVVHNLRAFIRGPQQIQAYDWAQDFEARVRMLIENGDHRALIDYPSLGQAARLAIPSPEHYLPLLYVLGAGDPADALTFPVSGTSGGSLSMLSVQFG